VLAAGGLYVIGTERHESRRIDNQLRGRSGRQGDPGASKFFVSLEDDLMRIFGSERMDTMLRRLGLKEGEAVVHPWINKALEKAQQKVEARNYEIRKNLLKFDDVMNDQRKVIYEQRIEMMRAEDVSETVAGMRHEVVDGIVARFVPEKAYPEQWQSDDAAAEMKRIFDLDLPVKSWSAEEGISGEEVKKRLADAADRKMAEKAANIGPPVMRMVEKNLLLQILDQHWKEHLLHLDHLRQGIGLRAYGQRDPLNEFKTEAFSMFEAMLGTLRESVTTVLSRVEVRLEAPSGVPDEALPEGMRNSRPDPVTGEDREAEAGARGRRAGRNGGGAVDPKDPSTWGKVARNAPCPCGSGKKFKHCHGRLS